MNWIEETSKGVSLVCCFFFLKRKLRGIYHLQDTTNRKIYKEVKRLIIMKIAFDLDGTLYDTLPIILEVDRAIRKDLGYQYVPREEYKSKFQSRDWNKFYRDLGIRDEHVEEVINRFIERFKLSNPPEIIPEAREVLQKTEQKLGHKNVYIVTNETPEGVKKRFERDGLLHYLDRIDNPFQGKSEELYRLAKSNNGNP